MILLKYIYSEGNYIIGLAVLYFMVTYIWAHESLWKSKEKIEPKETIKELFTIIIWPFYLAKYIIFKIIEAFKEF